MKVLKTLFAALMITSVISVEAQTKTIEGIDFPTSITIEGQKTVLNGGGLREKFGFLDLYVGALYVPSKTTDGNAVVLADENMGIRIEISSGLVTRDRFIEALEEGFENTAEGKSSPNDVELFKQYLSDEFVKGDVIELMYHAGEAVHLYKNGKERGSFAGLPFKQALFGIWLGEVPAQKSLKNEMLGK